MKVMIVEMITTMKMTMKMMMIMNNDDVKILTTFSFLRLIFIIGEFSTLTKRETFKA